jgi:hypothetical protein
MDKISEIKDRRQVSVEQAEAMLDLAASADTASKRSLLSAASRSLPDPRIMAHWISLANAEPDTELRGRMLARILRYDYRQIPDTGPYLDLLVWGLSQDDLRVPAVSAIGALATGNPATVELLTRLYHDQRTSGTQRQILEALCQSDTLNAPLAAFFLAAIGRADADLKTRMVRLLLRTDAIPPGQIAALLLSPGPAEMRVDLLRYVQDRSLAFEDAFSHVLAHDDDPRCRLEAVRALALLCPGSKETVRNLITAGQKDPAPEVREACLLLIRFSMELTPAVQLALIDDLRTETSRQNCFLILGLLAPYMSTSPSTQKAMLALLGENLHTEVAGTIYTMMGSLASWDKAIFGWLIDAYRQSASDSVKSAILESLSAYHEPSERLTAIYREALSAPVPRLKLWGLRGLLMVPLTPENAGSVAAAAGVLTDPALDRDTRLAIARKICRIPDPGPETIAALKNIVEQTGDYELKQVCQQAVDRAAWQRPVSSIDFDNWFYRAEADHNFDGIFPQIYTAYDEFPEQCRRILKVALLDPANADNLYKNNVSASQILRFLKSRGAIDNDICRYCANWVLTRDDSWGDPNLCLSVLRSHPHFPGLKETLWQIFQRKADVDKFNPVLLRFTLVAAFGGDTEAGSEFLQRLFRQTSAGAAAPYLSFLTHNLLWPPAEAMLREAAKKPAILDNETRKDLFKALHEYGDAEAGPDELQKPGVVDD